MKRKSQTILSIILTILLGGCDYLDIVPVGQVIPQKTSEYRALINTAYSIFPQNKVLLNMRGSQFHPEEDPWGMGLDGFTSLKDIYTWNDQNPDPLTREYPYQDFYRVIFFANEIINNGPNHIDDGTENMDQIIAEAYLLRAYSYFELVNMFAPAYHANEAATVKAVPLTTEIDIEQQFPRATLEEVYNLIRADIQKAESLMKEQSQTKEHRYRFSTESLLALKSRVGLYSGDWEKSLEAAKAALKINGELEDMNAAGYVPNTDYGSKEAILSVEMVTDMYLQDYASISEDLLGKYEEGDLRPDHYFTMSWMGLTITNKCMKTNEKVSFRRSELYLNAAESAARLKKENDARDFLLVLLKNRYKPEAFETKKQESQQLTGDELVEAILGEREKELALEGHQWYDYKRGDQPEIVKNIRGVEYKLQKNDSRYTLQIPRSAVEANPLLKD